MTIEDIRDKIMTQVEDDSMDTDVVDGYIQDADWAIQTWRPKDEKITFDFWDYLSDTKAYIARESDENGVLRLVLPDNFRGFIELEVSGDEEKYEKIDFSKRNDYTDHVCYIYGKYLYVKGDVDEGTSITLYFVHISDEFVSSQDEPEIESNYHGAYVAFGKARYYNQQGDTELENQNMEEFERIMMRKKADQEIIRMQTNDGSVGISKACLI